MEYLSNLFLRVFLSVSPSLQWTTYRTICAEVENWVLSIILLILFILHNWRKCKAMEYHSSLFLLVFLSVLIYYSEPRIELYNVEVGNWVLSIILFILFILHNWRELKVIKYLTNYFYLLFLISPLL